MSDALATAVTNTNPNSCVTVQTARLCKPWHVSQQGIDFVADWEAFRAHLYDNDGAGGGGNTTIGFGHLVHMGPISGAASEAPFHAGVTIAQARQLLLQDLRDPEHIVNKKIHVPLFQYEYDALVDFVYNLRHHNDALLNLVNSGHYDRVPAKFMEYTWASGAQPSGLVKRRRSEGNLFRDGNYDSSH
ncbi:lysozyme [Paraburkholderia pallida]|uniref:Lysozyme n=1 Tax=Paraburkholderia pallida TaxID=2547399 RepID=A0A4P7CZF1_9BURK|nr:lysozyme [Paraburkholderia pallida]QBR01716.1 glycoside hydrolase family 24 [Paraburkholderia pallida]